MVRNLRKNADSVLADKIFQNLVMKHGSDQLSTDQYFNEVVAKLSDWELPEVFHVEEDYEILPQRVFEKYLFDNAHICTIYRAYLMNCVSTFLF